MLTRYAQPGQGRFYESDRDDNAARVRNKLSSRPDLKLHAEHPARRNVSVHFSLAPESFRGLADRFPGFADAELAAEAEAQSFSVAAEEQAHYFEICCATVRV